MVAYIDEFKDRFRVGPIRRALAAPLDCGFITPRGYRMFKSRPVSRMAARHEALARDILEIHADSFMAVYGHRKTHAQLLARGRDPAETGRDQTMNVMRESGIRGVRRGRTPVTTKPAKGTDGLVHHSDHGAQYISLVCTTRVGEFGMLPSTGTVGDSYDNAMAESADGAYKTELVWRRKPFQDLRDLELATFRWVSWRNSKRLHQSLGYRTPEQTETEYYANQAAQAAPL